MCCFMFKENWYYWVLALIIAVLLSVLVNVLQQAEQERPAIPVELSHG